MKLQITLIALLCLPTIYANAAEYTCSNDYGECTISESSGSCHCADGMGTAWSGGSTGGASVGDDEVIVEDTEDGDGNELVIDEAACKEALSMNCPAHEKCESDKGICIAYDNDRANCTCADGSHNSGEGQTEPGYPGDDTDPDDTPGVEPTEEPRDEEGDTLKGNELVPLDTDFGCAEKLIAECPNDAPNAKEQCGNDSFEICNNLSGFFAECYNETVWPYMIIECCDNYKASKTEIDEMWACLKDKSCDNVSDCYGDMQPVGGAEDGRSNYESLLGEEGSLADKSSSADDDITDGDATDENESDDKSSDCNQNGSATGWLFLLFALAIFKPFRIKA